MTRRPLLRLFVLGVVIAALFVSRTRSTGRASQFPTISREGAAARTRSSSPVDARSRADAGGELDGPPPQGGPGGTPQYRDHLEFGAPSGADSSNDIRLARTEYALSYNPTRGGPNWVSWHLNATHFGIAPRCDCFLADPALPPGVRRVIDSDYRGSGYDRGHMVQSESRTTSASANASTFLLTNILPQAHNNNAGAWLKFETFVDRAVQTADRREAYLVAGGEYAANPPTLRDAGRVAIPDYTWKVVVFTRAGQGLADVHSADDLKVLAIRIPNLLSTAPPLRTPFDEYLTSVDDIEARTGLDLLALLPDDIERVVESTRTERPRGRWLAANEGGIIKNGIPSRSTRPSAARVR
jgi:endonuclease G